MMRIAIGPAKANRERSEAVRLAAVDGRSERMHIRITELDRDYSVALRRLSEVVKAARRRFETKH